jgi:hypothetical protein
LEPKKGAAPSYLMPWSRSLPPSFFRRRKPKDEKRLFICERRLRNPHAPRFSAPKIFRGAVAQYLPSRANRLVAGSLEAKIEEDNLRLRLKKLDREQHLWPSARTSSCRAADKRDEVAALGLRSPGAAN